MPPKPQKRVPSNAAIKPKIPVAGSGRGATKPASSVRGKVGAVGVRKSTQVSPPGVTAAPKKATVSQPVKKPVWSKEDEMARKIQTLFRAYRSRKLLLALQQKKKEYDDTIEKLQKEAFLHIVKMEQERAEKERLREEEERRKRKLEAARIKRMLEAAFDGENDDIITLLEEVRTMHSESGEPIVRKFQYKLIECCDANDNTPLSEASAGGHPHTINLLMDHDANPNKKGQYGRTPLYRAAFAGHVEAAQVLLKFGADPRIFADDGATPEQVSSHPKLKEMFEQWDINETDHLIQSLENKEQKRKENDEKIWQNKKDKLQSEIEEAEKEHCAKQKELLKAHEELNKRINEHDKSKNPKPELTLTAIHDAEDLLEICKINADSAKKKLQEAKLKMRMKRKEFQPDDEHEGSDPDEITADIIVNIREMDDVLMKDVGNKIADSDKWPFIIDNSRQCATFLMYRDTNYLNAVNPKDMQPETIRLSLLGAIRFGKFMVIDLSNIEDLWPAVVQKFNAVQENLLPALVSKEFLKEERYLKLIKPSDGDQYSAKHFLSARTHNFKLVILTQLPIIPPELHGKTYTIKIHTPEPTF